MKFVSTRGGGEPATLSQAIEEGLAPDGGLYVPDHLPSLDTAWFAPSDSLAQTGGRVFEPFFADDALKSKLAKICANALNFPVPLKFLPDSNHTAVLELFHGPTAAFKDIGARFLAECFSAMPSEKIRTILVATSGDTGAAVASAFHQKPGIQVAILFPKGGVSAIQQRQLTCWGENVRSFAVHGSFDDCQRLVKAAFAERATDSTLSGLTSANSINLGRLLPQTVYYASSSLEYFRKTGQKPGFVIPSGNFGNAAAALWAMKMSFPIREIVMATNANRVVPDYFETGVFTAQASVKTVANAMDVGNPSNFERVTQLFGNVKNLKKHAAALSVSDDQIRGTIAHGFKRYGEIWCPHTAAAAFARVSLGTPHWIVVATAHPAKFNDIVEPLIGKPVPMPQQLESLMARPTHFEELEPELAALRGALKKTGG